MKCLAVFLRQRGGGGPRTRGADEVISQLHRLFGLLTRLLSLVMFLPPGGDERTQVL